MILNMPGGLGRIPQHIPAADLAERFWASSWGLHVRLTGQEATVGLLTYLTAPAAQGGLQASWTDRAGLHEVADLIERTKPGESHG